MSSSTFQDAKDTFYLALRDRLAALNPDRTVVVRGATRAGIFVDENEALDRSLESTANAFVMTWTSYSCDTSEAVMLERGRCEIRYGSGGLAELAGMDRGRTLQAMDEELRSILQPASAPLLSFAGNSMSAPRTGTSRVFWSDAVYGDGTITTGRVDRLATVDVFAWKEDL